MSAAEATLARIEHMLETGKPLQELRTDMATYKAPLRDMRFVLHELLDVDALAKLPGYEEATRDLVEAMLEEAAKLCENVLLPLNRSRRRGRLPLRERRRAHAQGLQGGLQALPRRRLDRRSPARPDYGGQGLPKSSSLAGRGDDLLGQSLLRHVSRA